MHFSIKGGTHCSFGKAAGKQFSLILMACLSHCYLERIAIYSSKCMYMFGVVELYVVFIQSFS